MYEREEIKLREAWKKLDESFNQVAMQEEGGMSIEQLATISDEALDKAYQYGRSKPGNTFGWQANLKSAEFAKKMIDSGETDIEKISDAIHKGWNVTAKAFVENPDQFEDTPKLKAAGKLEGKIKQRSELMNREYAALPEDEKEKDRVVARAILGALKPQGGDNEKQQTQEQPQDTKAGGQVPAGQMEEGIFGDLFGGNPKVKELINGALSEWEFRGKEYGSRVTISKASKILGVPPEKIHQALHAIGKKAGGWAGTSDTNAEIDDYWVVKGVGFKKLAKLLAKEFGGDKGEQQPQQPPKPSADPNNAGAKADIMESIDRSLKLIKRLQK